MTIFVGLRLGVEEDCLGKVGFNVPTKGENVVGIQGLEDI